jgi:hypothetical protein
MNFVIKAHAGTLQLPQVTVVEKPGEFREAFAHAKVSMVILSEAC